MTDNANTIILISIMKSLLEGCNLKILMMEFSVNKIYEVVDFLSDDSEVFTRNMKFQAGFVKQEIITQFPIEQFPEVYI